MYPWWRVKSSPTSLGSIPFSDRVVEGIAVSIDVVVVFAFGIASYVWLVGWSVTSYESYVSAVILICLVFYALLKYGDLCTVFVLMRPFAYFDKLFLAVIVSFLLLLATLFSLKVSEDFSRVWIYTFASGCFATIFAERVLMDLILKQLSARALVTRNVAVVGDGEQARVLLSRLREAKPYFTTVLGVFGTGSGAEPVGEVEGYAHLGNVDALVEKIRHERVDHVILALPWSDDDSIMQLMGRLREVPVTIHLACDLIGFRLDRAHAAIFGDSNSRRFPGVPVVELSRQPLSDWDVVVKAVEDRLLALVLLVLGSPIMLLTAIAIKLTSPGPILFRQERLGFNNHRFWIYKFRSMRHDQMDKSVTEQAKRGDPRITAVGKLIRRTSIDELPQLVNVLNGTMSLVGPRPHAIDHNEMYSSQIRGYFARHRVKPGLTGWAQVNGLRGETRTLGLMEKRVQHDLFYVENWSLMFDIQILLKTAFIVITGRNAY
jgi:Undecaprenyl-phosphate glucose phosphotransferase